MEGFCGKKGAINNKKRKDYFGAETSFLRETWEGLYHADCLCFSMGMERAHVTDYLIGAKFQTG